MAIEVRDTGIGMTADEQQRVFDEFTQGNDDIRRLFGGTGLGLAISRKLVHAMGGSILIRSSPGSGSAFVVMLPLTHEVAGEPQSHSPGGASSSPQAHRSLRTMSGRRSKNVALWCCRSAIRKIWWIHWSRALLPWPTPSSATANLRRPCVKRHCGEKFRREIYVMMRAEERRQNADLLTEPFCGYVLKPFRRHSLIRTLTLHDDGRIALAVQDLRNVLKAQRRQVPLDVLLAEDNPVNALLARTMLIREGYSVTRAATGEEVLQILQTGPRPDLIIMDVEMPVLDGLAATRQIRLAERDSGDKRLPILALTANARKEDIAECLAAGMDGHLSKPFDRQDLEETIARLMKRQAAA